MTAMPNAAQPSLVASPRRAPARIVLETQPPRFQGMVAEWKRLHAEPYVGITTDGQPDTNLFPICATGLSCAPVVAAAEAFLATLDAEQRASARFGIDDRAWRGWSNIHRNVMRHGVCLDVLSAEQRRLALDIVRACVGERTFDEVVATMRLNEHLSELTGKPGEYGEWFYYVSIFGEPSQDRPWGWQLDGHHVNINCFLLDGQAVLTPMLLGAEPVCALSGKYQGTMILRREEAAGLDFMQALRPDQRATATLGLELPFDGLGSGFKDNLQVPYQGIAFGALDSAQQGKLRDLVRLYVDRQAPAHAAHTWADVEFHMDYTNFAWLGPFDDISPFYYRVHSPVIYIEFFHQPGIALPNNGFTRQHAHALVRTPNGNDYGRALLGAHRRQCGEVPGDLF
jgi:hypothetical protein